jgi:hypothetical protein
MTDDDAETFRRELNAVAGAFGRKLPPETVGVYFEVLADLPLARVLAALKRFARTAETGARFPSPRDLHTLARETASPKRQPTERELARIVTATNLALAAWERAGGVVGARLTFDQAWRAACQQERVLPSANDRERCWQAYLQSGQETRGSHEWMLEEALAREATRHGGKPPRSTVFSEVFKRRDREPGEDNDG